MKPTTLLKHHQVSSTLEVRENTQTGYHSMFAAQNLKATTVLSKFGYETKLTIPSRFSVQINETEHITLKPQYLQYINHSCNPNVFFDTQKMQIEVLRDIREGEEICFFYPSTEWKMTESFDCSCKSERCLGKIQGAAYLTSNQIEKYRLSEYILQK
ncbi:MAG: SET domain-containing protein-lysine N-methyltransferase [Chitinophagales bacterium]